MIPFFSSFFFWLTVKSFFIILAITLGFIVYIFNLPHCISKRYYATLHRQKELYNCLFLFLLSQPSYYDCHTFCFYVVINLTLCCYFSSKIQWSLLSGALFKTNGHLGSQSGPSLASYPCGEMWEFSVQ